jgi:hypothetical protein
MSDERSPETTPRWPTPRYLGRIFLVYLAVAVGSGALFTIGAFLWSMTHAR